MPGRAVIALGAYLVVLLVHLGVRLADLDRAAQVTQWFLAPLLLVTLLTAPVPASRLTRLVAAGLVLSWLGDLLPGLVENHAFLWMVGCFLVAQALYAAAFWPFRDERATGAWSVVYPLATIGLLAWVAPGTGSLLWPVVAYAVAITAMVMLASGVHPLAWVGATLFVLSDGLIAVNRFVPGWDLPGQGFWVMLTYGLAQLLIVLGVLARRRADSRPGPEPGER